LTEPGAADKSGDASSPPRKEQAFIDHFLKAFPSTLRAAVITSP
jgi:hypothetical protein